MRLLSSVEQRSRYKRHQRTSLRLEQMYKKLEGHTLTTKMIETQVKQLVFAKSCDLCDVRTS